MQAIEQKKRWEVLDAQIEKTINEIMKTHDKDSSGFLDKKETKLFLLELLLNLGINVTFTSDTFDELYASCDKNGDGNIQKPEIKLIMYKMIGKRENEAEQKWQGVSEDAQKVRQRMKEKELKMAEEAAARANAEDPMVLSCELQIPVSSPMEQVERSKSQGSGRKPDNPQQEALKNRKSDSQQSSNASVKFQMPKGRSSKQQNHHSSSSGKLVSSTSKEQITPRKKLEQPLKHLKQGMQKKIRSLEAEVYEKNASNEEEIFYILKNRLEQIEKIEYEIKKLNKLIEETDIPDQEGLTSSGKKKAEPALIQNNDQINVSKWRQQVGELTKRVELDRKTLMYELKKNFSFLDSSQGLTVKDIKKFEHSLNKKILRPAKAVTSSQFVLRNLLSQNKDFWGYINYFKQLSGMIKTKDGPPVEPVGLYGYDMRKSMSPKKDKASPNKSQSPEKDHSNMNKGPFFLAKRGINHKASLTTIPSLGQSPLKENEEVQLRTSHQDKLQVIQSERNIQTANPRKRSKKTQPEEALIEPIDIFRSSSAKGEPVVYDQSKLQKKYSQASANNIAPQSSLMIRRQRHLKRNSQIPQCPKLNVDGSIPSLSRIMQGEVYYDTFKDFYGPPPSLKNVGMGPAFLQTSVSTTPINNLRPAKLLFMNREQRLLAHTKNLHQERDCTNSNEESGTTKDQQKKHSKFFQSRQNTMDKLYYLTQRQLQCIQSAQNRPKYWKGGNQASPKKNAAANTNRTETSKVFINEIEKTGGVQSIQNVQNVSINETKDQIEKRMKELQQSLLLKGRKNKAADGGQILRSNTHRRDDA